MPVRFFTLKSWPCKCIGGRIIELLVITSLHRRLLLIIILSASFYSFLLSVVHPFCSGSSMAQCKLTSYLISGSVVLKQENESYYNWVLQCPICPYAVSHISTLVRVRVRLILFLIHSRARGDSICLYRARNTAGGSQILTVSIIIWLLLFIPISFTRCPLHIHHVCSSIFIPAKTLSWERRCLHFDLSPNIERISGLSSALLWIRSSYFSNGSNKIITFFRGAMISPPGYFHRNHIITSFPMTVMARPMSPKPEIAWPPLQLLLWFIFITSFKVGNVEFRLSICQKPIINNQHLQSLAFRSFSTHW